jgi:hypothetical protein
MEADLAHYKRRLAEEGAAAAAALHPKVRKTHFALAAAYEQRIAELEAERGARHLHLVSAA